MKNKYWWIKERHNPQFKKPYYILYGNSLSIARAKEIENTSYGDSIMHRFETKELYDAMVNRLNNEKQDVMSAVI